MQMKTAAIRVVLVDRNRLYRVGLGQVLAANDIEVVHECDSVVGGSDVDADGVDVVVIGHAGNNVSAREWRSALEAFPDSKIVLIVEPSFDTNLVFTAARAGVHGIVTSELSPDAFLQSLRLVALGEKIVPARAAGTLIGGDGSFETRRAGANLSDRETEILALLADGSSNREIASELAISEATVKVHVKAILRKIGVENRTKAAIWALNRSAAAADFDGER